MAACLFLMVFAIELSFWKFVCICIRFVFCGIRHGRLNLFIFNSYLKFVFYFYFFACASMLRMLINIISWKQTLSEEYCLSFRVLHCWKMMSARGFSWVQLFLFLVKFRKESCGFWSIFLLSSRENFKLFH